MMPPLLLDHLWFILLDYHGVLVPSAFPQNSSLPTQWPLGPMGVQAASFCVGCPCGLGSEPLQGGPSILASDLPAHSSTPSTGLRASISVGGIDSVQNPSKKERRGSFRSTFLSHLGPPVNPKGLLTIHSHTPKDALPSPASFSLSTYYVPDTSGTGVDPQWHAL